MSGMDFEHKRKFRRQRLIEPAQIRLEGSTRAYASIVIDVSAGGARLRVPASFAVHDHILITAPSVGDNRPAGVVWADATSIGVRFQA